MFKRYFYNGTSMACETFYYGGCMGNGNNFPSEKECLQTCRTVGECHPTPASPALPSPVLPTDHLPTEQVANRGCSGGGIPGPVSWRHRN